MERKIAPQLREDEVARWLDDFSTKMGKPSEAEKAFFDRRRSLAQGVGLEANGNLICDNDQTTFDGKC
ncbi:hypothetical protein [Falsihalocynthiibacter arcticus]|uniref:Uncharacterized protein n=1 Tax=Falsihalocynthiibacter arcticus TaxID=1579316 RepID=A0A126V3F1_9RHOB|nr:hypothetical protein [Falsihalocynthiibacter arcticus]AML52844.1 hypothetical protein RC74_17680 [Falsihalocynthiibacter arcticus]